MIRVVCFPTEVRPKAAGHWKGGETFQALSRVLLPYKNLTAFIFAEYLLRLLIKLIFKLAIDVVDTCLKLQRFSHSLRLHNLLGILIWSFYSAV